MRAAFADLTHQAFQGASTITQQLARQFFLNDEVSISRKIQEALLAMEIERYYTKDEILERYFNIIYLGAGAYGVDAAAHTYFGKGVEKLNVGAGGDACRRRRRAVGLLAVRQPRAWRATGSTTCSIAWSRAAISRKHKPMQR